MVSGEKQKIIELKTIDLTIVVDSTNKNRVKVAKLIEKQLEGIGINVYVNDVTKSGYERRLKQKRL